MAELCRFSPTPGSPTRFAPSTATARATAAGSIPHGKTGYRLDHLFVRGLQVLDCAYEHGWRERGLPDHSALWARVAP